MKLYHSTKIENLFEIFKSGQIKVNPVIQPKGLTRQSSLCPFHSCIFTLDSFHEFYNSDLVIELEINQPVYPSLASFQLRVENSFDSKTGLYDIATTKFSVKEFCLLQDIDIKNISKVYFNKNSRFNDIINQDSIVELISELYSSSIENQKEIDYYQQWEKIEKFIDWIEPITEFKKIWSITVDIDMRYSSVLSFDNEITGAL